jgi:hypothetical protein
MAFVNAYKGCDPVVLKVRAVGWAKAPNSGNATREDRQRRRAHAFVESVRQNRKRVGTARLQ